MTDWNQISDEYAHTHVEPITPVRKLERAITPDDLDDIFAGRPLAEQPRAKASIMRKTYLTPDMAAKADRQAKAENLSGAALLRKALADYLNRHQTAMA